MMPDTEGHHLHAAFRPAAAPRGRLAMPYRHAMPTLPPHTLQDRQP